MNIQFNSVQARPNSNKNNMHFGKMPLKDAKALKIGDIIFHDDYPEEKLIIKSGLVGKFIKLLKRTDKVFETFSLENNKVGDVYPEEASKNYSKSKNDLVFFTFFNKKGKKGSTTKLL